MKMRKSKFDVPYAERLYGDLNQNEILFNAFMFTGIGFGLSALTLFLIDLLAREEVQVDMRPIGIIDGFGLTLELSW